MKRSWKSLTVLSLVLLLSLVLTGIASAEVIRGKGWLQAEGAGVAVLRMSGHIKIEGHGTGVIYIYNFDELQAEGHGRRSNLHGGGVLFRGHTGAITASGDRMLVRIVGGRIEFDARGQGTAYLRGRGTYETGSGSGDWAPDGFNIEVVEE